MVTLVISSHMNRNPTSGNFFDLCHYSPHYDVIIRSGIQRVALIVQAFARLCEALLMKVAADTRQFKASVIAPLIGSIWWNNIELAFLNLITILLYHNFPTICSIGARLSLLLVHCCSFPIGLVTSLPLPLPLGLQQSPSPRYRKPTPIDCVVVLGDAIACMI